MARAKTISIGLACILAAASLPACGAAGSDPAATGAERTASSSGLGNPSTSTPEKVVARGRVVALDLSNTGADEVGVDQASVCLDVEGDINCTTTNAEGSFQMNATTSAAPSTLTVERDGFVTTYAELSVSGDTDRTIGLVSDSQPPEGAGILVRSYGRQYGVLLPQEGVLLRVSPDRAGSGLATGRGGWLALNASGDSKIDVHGIAGNVLCPSFAGLASEVAEPATARAGAYGLIDVVCDTEND